ncbi:MAG: hypothetical protein GY944_30530, partial [bacterium]|nr:hypothetical protein [bacterium]
WRKERAGHDGFPPYIIFSNRELAAIATLAPPTTTALQEIDGIGPAKAERYGKAVLARCHPNAPATTTEAKA